MRQLPTYVPGDRVRGTVFGILRAGTVTLDTGYGVTWVVWDFAPEFPRFAESDSLERIYNYVGMDSGAYHKGKLDGMKM